LTALHHGCARFWILFVGDDMDSFRWVAVVLSIILGLGVTRLLSSAVEVFRSRNQAHLDWVPLAWEGNDFWRVTANGLRLEE